MSPENLSLRTVNQYRTRDIFAYLGLRYYFANLCTRRDRWAIDVSAHLVSSNKDPSYFSSLHFKERLEDGSISHREIFIPGPNEAYAEAALLAECANYSEFKQSSSVFSYALTSRDDSKGMYAPYFAGLQERHRAISKACSGTVGQVVLYTDIKRFYPSISLEVARQAWRQACDKSKITANYRTLGDKLLSHHDKASKATPNNRGLLTGPMFSHLIANLVLRDLDEEMSASFPGRYFRYVDDVVLVGTKDQVAAGRELIESRLRTLGLELHGEGSGKDFQISTDAWMIGAEDFDDSISKGWMTLSRNVKQFLLTQPQYATYLSEAFISRDFRIPLPDYQVAVQDSGYKDRFNDSLKRHPWLLKTIYRDITPEKLIEAAESLRQNYADNLNGLLGFGCDIDGYQRKRLIPKIRYFAGRLLYLARKPDLISISRKLSEYPELYMLAEIMAAVATRDVSKLLPLGSNAVQSAAQVLSLDISPVECRIETWGKAELQGMAILRAHGIFLDGPDDDELNKFVLWGKDSKSLMHSKNSFMQELACLHGVSPTARHRSMLITAFGRGEELAFDATSPLETY